MEIRPSWDADVPDLLRVSERAFGPGEGQVVAGLVNDVLHDPSAQPVVSLVAVDQEKIVGHALFSRAGLEGIPAEVSASILAPLAVIPERQREGIGGKLLKAGLEMLSKAGVELVFLAGHPSYYPRHGFEPAGKHGFDAPYPIPDENADAWMVHALRPESLNSGPGTVVCADALNKPEYWRE